MSVEIPITQDLVTRNISIFEGKLNKTVPATDKAFLRVLSVALAMMETELVKKQAYDTKQNLALTADYDGLKDIGIPIGVDPVPAEAAVLTGTISADTGKTIGQSTSFIGDSNGVRYFPDSTYTESGGVITVTLTAEDVGSVGNLSVSDTMSITSQLAGIGTVLTITSIDNVGADEQDIEVYRQRVLTQLRTLKGGGNAADYRRWAESVAGVVAAYPYAGLPYPQNPLNAVPPDRTVYVQATTDIDADGIAPSSLLDEVRDAINTDPVTGLDNEPLGLVNEQLYVESIRRTTFYFEIVGLDVPAADEASIKSQIATALDEYSRGLTPYIDGLDFIGDKNDTISDLTISELVQGIISSVGGDAEGVTFGLSPGVNIPRYTLGEGELGKSGGVTYS